jgi:hypothetical protein
MEVLGWTFSFMFWAMYIVCIFTVCLLTFQKGHTILGILGIFLPLLWLIGAVLPAKPGSRYEQAQEARFSAQAQQGST